MVPIPDQSGFSARRMYGLSRTSPGLALPGLTLPTINLTTEHDFSRIFLGFLRFELLILTLILTLPTKNTSFYAVFPLLGRLKLRFRPIFSIGI